jgi:uncharacterized protein
MIIIISPAKKINMLSMSNIQTSKPIFDSEVIDLVKIAKKMSVIDLKNLMGISDNLASLNADRFANFGMQEKKAAAFTFAGDTYKGLDFKTMNTEDIDWAQKHLKILSGLYGLLRPLDAIEPYRLEMGSKLQGDHGSSLYEYWNDKITKSLNQYGKEIGAEVLVNCASNEYFNVIKPNRLSLRVITPVFLERKDGIEKIISFFAKNARGAMARFIIQNRVLDELGLKKFNLNGYLFCPQKSNNDQFVFIRDSL